MRTTNQNSGVARFASPLPAMLAAGMFLAASVFPAQAKVPISQDPHITRSLVAAMVGEGIRRTCPSIHARFIVALNKAKELERYALSKGYSKAEIEAFLKSPEHKARIISLARAYMLENGVVEGDKDTYCRLGRAEIAAGTLTGQLLWSWK